MIRWSGEMGNVATTRQISHARLPKWSQPRERGAVRGPAGLTRPAVDSAPLRIPGAARRSCGNFRRRGGKGDRPGGKPVVEPCSSSFPVETVTAARPGTPQPRTGSRSAP